ncbi:SDR family NAD(P)-dependent oxidoreductase [Mycobacterium sp.]|uniref:SDR family NAD(P)-dependent oxidoreductase n=1 Tax=Mycobacterium sp. TaxID=1785 RepID=UPI003F97F489
MPGVDGRVAIVTGAGRGLGRSHALRLAAGGALVVVNDLGVRKEGGGADATAAHGVVEEIRAAGGVAVPDDHDIASETGARAVVSSALEAFGRLASIFRAAWPSAMNSGLVDCGA